MGGGVSRVDIGEQRHGHGEVATDLRGPGPSEHRPSAGIARVHLPHQCLQQPGGQDIGRSINTAGYAFITTLY